MAENTTDTTEALAVTVIEEKRKPSREEEDALEVPVMTDKTTKVKFTGLLTIPSFLLCLPLIASIIWLLIMRDYDCENLLRLPKLRIGIDIVLIIVLLVHGAVFFLRNRFPMLGLVAVMVPLFVMLIIGLSLLGAMESRVITATPKRLKLKLQDDNNWNNIKSCIYDGRVCDDLISTSLRIKSYDFSMTKLSFIESGCCKPPETCEMEYVNATFWRKNDGAADKLATASYDSDCDTWKNNPNVLCYNCNSCKQGYLRTLQTKWWKLGILLVVMAPLFIIANLLLFTATMLERFKG